MNTKTNETNIPVTGKYNPLPDDERYREGFIKKSINTFIVSLLWLISLLPFRVLYLISDFLYLVARYIIRYRHKVITGNINFAFPEKTSKEKKQIAAKFYRHFCDLMMETVKLSTVSEKQINKRLKAEGLEYLDDLYNKGTGFIILAMHHNNWEWYGAIMARVQHRMLMLYNPIRGNQALEKFILHSRERWGGKCVPVHLSARVVLEFNQKKIPSGIWLGADQAPPATSKFWTIFLNREAPFFSGPGKIAAKTNLPVLFLQMTKTDRGRYTVRIIPMIEKPAEMPQEEIMLAYVKKMEEIIRQEPENYLWSHRRWKHKRPENIPLIT